MSNQSTSSAREHSRERHRQERERERERRNRERQDERDRRRHDSMDDDVSRDGTPRRDGSRQRRRTPSRSRSPGKFPQPTHSSSSRHDRDRRRPHGDRSPDRRRDTKRRRMSPKVELSDLERDKRTVFVQQLAARLRTQEFGEFFEKAGPVRDASIVKDKLTNRSKGVGYVEFEDLESVSKAIAMTGEKLLGIPVIVQFTETEKNRQAAEAAKSAVTAASKAAAELAAARSAKNVGSRFVLISNVQPFLTEDAIRDEFRRFGKINLVSHPPRSVTAEIEFADASDAAESVAQMNGVQLEGKALVVELGEDKSLSNGAAGDIDEDSEKAREATHAALVDRLMKEAQMPPTEQEPPAEKAQVQEAPSTTPAPSQPSRCILLRNMFDPAAESGDSWVGELEEDVKEECEEKYGKVLHISVDATSRGDIYLKFETVDSGTKAFEGLDGRKFDGRLVKAETMVEMVYSVKFPKS